MTTKRGETAAIVPSETKPVRKAPMTMDEMYALLARERAEIEAAGRPLIDEGWRHRRASIRQNER